MSVVARRLIGARSLVFLALAMAVAWAAPPRAATPVPQKGSNKTVFAIAVDGDQKPVTDLTKREWGVREDGADRVLVDLKPATEPLDLVLMVDTSRSIQVSVTELRAALQSFTHAILAGNPGATISVVDVAGAAVMVAEGKTTNEDLDKILSKTFADPSETTVFLEGIMDAAKKLTKSPSPRRAIVVVNLDGIPESSSLQPPKVVKQILDSGASLWAVSYRNSASGQISVRAGSGSNAVTSADDGGSKAGGIGPGSSGQNRDLMLGQVPPGTGGFRLTIGVPSALEVSLGKVAAALLGQYAVTYTRPDGSSPKQLQMGQTRRGVKVIYPSAAPK